MKLFVFIILIILEYSTVKCELNSSVQLQLNDELFLRTRPIQMNEELDADTQLVNLTELIYSLIVNKSSNIESNLRIDSVRFAADSEWTEYFKLDTKQISFSSASKLIKSIDLKTSSLKRIDRETICTVAQQKPCQITIKLIAQFDSKEVQIEVPININDSNDNKPAFYQSDIRIDIDLNKPMPPLVKIPLKLAYDLDSTYENRIQEYSLTHLNKNTTDLAGTNRVHLKYLKRQNKESLSLVLNSTELDSHVSETEIFQLKAKDPNYDTFQTIEIKFIKQKLQHVFALFEKNFYNLTLTTSNQISLSVLANSKTMASTCDTIKFNAYNPQLNNKIVLADFRLDKHMLSIAFVNTFKLNQVRLVARCGDLNDTAFVILNESPSANKSLFNLNLISAVNDLDINETLNNVYEFKFKTSDSTKGSSSSSISNSNTANLNSSFVTLAYLIAEQQPQPFSQQQQQPHHPDNSVTKFKLNKEMDESYHDLIRIDEMRNGLYAFKLSSKYLNLIKKLNSNEDDYDVNSVSYTIKLSLVVIDWDLNIGRTLKLRMPQLRLIQTTPNLSPPPLPNSALHVERADVSTQILTKKTLTISSTVTVTAATLISSFNLFNSVVLITAISVVLILIALGCFIVSLSLYLKSKCRQMKQIKQINKSGHLPEINLNLTDKKLLKMSGSSSIELGSAESGISSGQPSSSSSSSSSDLSCNSSTITTTTNNKQHFNLLKASNDFMPSNHHHQQQQQQKPSWVNQNAIMVYDVMPSQHLHTNPPIPSSSVSSSSSSSSNYQKSAMDSSNISPITTTSGVDSAVSASSSMKHHQALLQLSTKHLEATKNIKWYMDANSSNSTDLIRPLPVKLQSSEKSDSSLNLNKEYRNEIYRNSHLIFKNAQYSQMKKNLSKKQADEPTEQSNFKTYEAKPISLNNKELYSATTIGTTNSNINSSSSLDNYDTVNFDSMSSNSINLANGFSNREKMVNRLSTAISIVTNSSENSSSCLANKSLSKINSNNLSMADSEQVSSV